MESIAARAVKKRPDIVCELPCIEYPGRFRAYAFLDPRADGNGDLVAVVHQRLFTTRPALEGEREPQRIASFSAAATQTLTGIPQGTPRDRLAEMALQACNRMLDDAVRAFEKASADLEMPPAGDAVITLEAVEAQMALL